MLEKNPEYLYLQRKIELVLENMFQGRISQNPLVTSQLEESNLSQSPEETHSKITVNPAEIAYKNRFWIGLGKKLVKRGANFSDS